MEKLEFQWRELVFAAEEKKSGEFSVGEKTAVVKELLYRGLKCESNYKVGDKIQYDPKLARQRTVLGVKYDIMQENTVDCKIVQ